MLRYLAVLLLVLGLVATAPRGLAAAASPGPVAGPAAGAAVPAAALAVTALAGAHPPDDPLAVLPADFVAVMGYAPTVVRLPGGAERATKPAGACSAPGGGRRFGFGPACRAHDLGYDLLRYAVAVGDPLDPDARRSLDAMLADDLHATCRVRNADALGCHLLAATYVAGAQLNSWRQGHGPPVPEPYLPWVIGLVVLGLAAVPVARLAPRPRRARRLPPRSVEAAAAETPGVAGRAAPPTRRGWPAKDAGPRCSHP